MSVPYRVPLRFTTGLQPARLSFSASGFSGSHAHLMSRTFVDVDPHDLVRVAVHMGHPWASGAGTKRRRPRLQPMEIAYRASVVRAFLKTRADGAGFVWRASKSYLKGLESTEKGGVGYALGMVFAVTLAEQLLQTPHSLHVSMYAKPLGVHFDPPAPRTRARTPDLLMRDRTGTLHALEAKARFAPSPKAWIATMEDALEQAQGTDRDGLIGGARVASGLQIARADGRLSMHWIDPPGDAQHGRTLDQVGFMRAYYERIGTFLEGSPPDRRTIGERRFVVRQIPEADLDLGLAADLYDAIAEENWDLLRHRAAEQPVASHDEDWSIGADGVVVLLGRSWSTLAEDEDAET